MMGKFTMRTRIRSLLVALLVMGGSALEASGTWLNTHDWTFQVGGRTFGFIGAKSYKHEYRTFVHYGYGDFESTLPVQVVAAVCGAVPLLGLVGYLFFVRRRPVDPR